MTTVGLCFGYAEESLVGMLLLANDDGFSTKEEIVVSLASHFTINFLGKMSKKKISFCKKDHSKVSTPFCPICGTSIEDKPTIDDFKDWLVQLTRLHAYPDYDDSDWRLADIEDGCVIDFVFKESSENLIADKVLELFPDQFEDDR